MPIYQRGYAWREDEIDTLLQDIADSRKRNNVVPYYLGSLVVHESRLPDSDLKIFEVVDGQQRLTTLFLILCHQRVAGVLEPETRRRLDKALRFEGRERSTADLALLARRARDVTTGPAEALQDAGLRTGVMTIDRGLSGSEFTDQDIRYLLDQVHIVRSRLPARTDLNHYFEVMNSRGEQLEKHEIVKARLLRAAGDSDQAALARLWDACSDMSKHVQAGFSPRERTALFGQTWESFVPSDASALFGLLDPTTSTSVEDTISSRETSLTSILAAAPIAATNASLTETEDDEASRYGSIIDFPNFLLHALRVHRGQRFSWDSTEAIGNVPLDDKQLIEQFSKLADAAEVRQFGYVLLRLRYLFDRFVIKTDRTRDNSSDDSNWVLQRAHRVGEAGKFKLSPMSTFGPKTNEEESDTTDTGFQRRIVMVQSMFQVSDARRSYKNFLYGILDFLWRHDQPDAPTFMNTLHDLAASRPATTTNLDEGVRVPHFMFNFLDYKLWHEYAVRAPGTAPDGVDIQNFRFRYRTSVEHFYPQNPDEGEAHQRLAARDVDRFGNLCLMTQSENSRRSNLMPLAKIGQYSAADQSLKFQVMASIVRRAPRDAPWTTEHIRDHGEAMRAILAHPW